MLRDALSVLPHSDDGIGTAIVGGVLLLLAVVLLPLWIFVVAAPSITVESRVLLGVVLLPLAFAPVFVLRGYYVAVLDAGRKDEPSAPSFVGWGGLYQDGIKSLLLSILYLLPVGGLILLGGAAGYVIQLGRVNLGGMGEAAFAISMLFLALLIVGYLMVFLYLRPAALACMAATGRLRDGVQIGRVVRLAFSGEYATGWLLAMFVTIAGLFLAGPFVFLLVGFPAVFGVRIVTHNLYGRGASDQLRTKDGVEPRDTSEEAPLQEDPASAADVPETDTVADVPETDTVADVPETDTVADVPETDTVADVPGETEPIAEEVRGYTGTSPDSESVSTQKPPEPSVDVQVGRRVPLTAMDILHKAASRDVETGRDHPTSDHESPSSADSESPERTEQETEPPKSGTADTDSDEVFEWAETEGQ